LIFGSTVFIYGQERYFASKQFLIFRITISVCLQLVNLFYCIVALNIWLK